MIYKWLSTNGIFRQKLYACINSDISWIVWLGNMKITVVMINGTDLAQMKIEVVESD